VNFHDVIIFLCGLLAIVVSWFYWPKSERSILGVALIGACMAGFIVVGGVIDRFIPVKQRVVQEVVTKDTKVVYKERVIYRTPGQDLAPVNPKAICSGASPLQIDKMSVQTNDKDKDDSTTWVVGHVPGSRVLVTCGQPGAYDDFWKVGDIVQMTRGNAQ
jgi:hypothetical protein